MVPPDLGGGESLLSRGEDEAAVDEDDIDFRRMLSIIFKIFCSLFCQTIIKRGGRNIVSCSFPSQSLSADFFSTFRREKEREIISPRSEID